MVGGMFPKKEIWHIHWGIIVTLPSWWMRSPLVEVFWKMLVLLFPDTSELGFTLYCGLCWIHTFQVLGFRFSGSRFQVSTSNDHSFNGIISFKDKFCQFWLNSDQPITLSSLRNTETDARQEKFHSCVAIHGLLSYLGADTIQYNTVQQTFFWKWT